MAIIKKKLKDGTVSWGFDFYVKGSRKREFVGPSKTLARKAWEARKTEVRQGRYSFKSRRKGPLFEALVEKYLEHARVNKKPSSYQRDIFSTKRLLESFKGRRLEHITPDLVEEYKQQRQRIVKPATINREVLCLKRMFNVLLEKLLKVEGGDVVSSNPGAPVHLLKEPEKKPRILCDEEIERLLLARDGTFRAIVICLWQTGLRLRECLDLKWENVNLRDRYITVENTKNNKIRRVAINGLLAQALRKLDVVNEWVFPSSQKPHKPYTSTGFRATFNRTLKRAGIKGATPHDLRHSFCTRLATRGCDLPTLQAILGHSSIGLLLRYSHPSDEHKMKAVNLAMPEGNGHLMDTLQKPVVYAQGHNEDK